ncbi:MAG: hypothetical protein SNJ84_10495, partial [Verrucomicrobiia bacterium]
MPPRSSEKSSFGHFTGNSEPNFQAITLIISCKDRPGLRKLHSDPTFSRIPFQSISCNLNELILPFISRPSPSSRPPMKIPLTSLLVLPILAASSAWALINPQVQPRHFFEEFNSAAFVKVQSVDTRNELKAELKVLQTHKGNFPEETITLTSSQRELLPEFLALSPGTPLVVFAGKERPRSARMDGIYYGGGGKWYRFRMTDDPKVWEMVGDADKGVDP